MDHLVIVLTFNRPSLAEARADELHRLYSKSPLVQFLIFDNGSTDPSVRLLRAAMSSRGLNMMGVTENLGFSRGMNTAVRVGSEILGTADVIHLLSDDVAILGDFVAGAEAHLTAHARSLVCHRLISWPAGWNQFGKTVVPYPDGYYIAVPRAIWTELHGFDEAFSPYDYEDVDLGYRCGLAGVGVDELRHLPLRHDIAQTLGYTPARAEHTQQMRRVFAEKHGLPLAPERVQ